jgi:hypothetical protein
MYHHHQQQQQQQDILNNTDQFSAELDNLTRILIEQESHYNEPIKLESNDFYNDH